LESEEVIIKPYTDNLLSD